MHLARHGKRSILRWGRSFKPDTTGLLVLLAIGLIVILTGSIRSLAAADDKKTLEPLNRFGRMVQEYFVRQVRRVERAGDRRRGELKSRADAEAYIQDVREKIQQCFGPWPQKSPLNAVVTGTVERPQYTIEKIIFESRPGFLVTANLYLPKGRKFPLPGVVGACGHSNNGKAEPLYQSFAQALARMGYVVLIYDPLGQGERLQYPDDKLKSRIGTGVREHLYAGNQQFLVGEFLGSWRAWDGIRALDYLLTRPEVDARRIGVTGNSGGGTMTTWLCGVEPRWTMAAPGCFVTTFRHNLENELPADTEQCPPRALGLGLDHSDFLAAQAPDPVIILAKERDYFDVRGARQAYGRLEDLYRLLEADARVDLFVGPTQHGYTQENRLAMYRWFNRWSGLAPVETEPELTIEKDETLWCAPDGQVCRLQSRPIYAFTREKALQLAQKRTPPPAGSDLRQKVMDLLRLESFRRRTEQPSERPSVPYRILPGRGNRDYPQRYAVTYAVETEPGIHAIVTLLRNESWQSRPPQGERRAILYIAHHSADAELREDPFLAELCRANPETPFYACDVRGIGESRPDTCGPDSFLHPYGSDYFYAIHSIMLDRPYLGQKTGDVLRVLDWLGEQGCREVHLVGRGWGALPATFAALLSDRVSQVTLKNALTSFSAVATSETYAWPLSCLIPGVLEQFDLPDCYRELQAKKHLVLLEPWDENAEIVPSD